jgi:cyclin-dependent kinase
MLGGSLIHARRSPASDMWVFACAVHHLFADLFLFPINQDSSEFAQLMEIFKLLGTPNEQSYPGVTRMQHYSPHFPKWCGSLLVHLHRCTACHVSFMTLCFAKPYT